MSEAEYEIHELQTEEECLRMTECQWIAGYDPYHPVFAARHPLLGPTAADRAASIRADSERNWHEHTHNPASRWIFVVHKPSGAMITSLQWLLFAANPFPHGPQRLACAQHPAGTAANAYVAEFMAQISYPRQAWMQRAHAGVNAVGVLRAHRRRGVGRMMLRWGLERADALGVECFFEALPMGCLLYEACGFRRLMDIRPNMDVVDPSDDWKRLLHEFEPPVASLLYRPIRGDWDGEPHTPWEKLIALERERFTVAE